MAQPARPPMGRTGMPCMAILQHLLLKAEGNFRLVLIHDETWA
jgi:hypothetical protein